MSSAPLPPTGPAASDDAGSSAAPGSSADATASAPYRVVVADDDVLLREGIARLLGDAGYTVVGQASDAPTLLGTVRSAQPDLVIADIRMPPTQTAEGIEVAQVIRFQDRDAECHGSSCRGCER